MTMDNNLLLSRLSDEEKNRLGPNLREVAYALGDELYTPSKEPKSLYFPQTGIISVLIMLEDGRAGEIAVVGHEGVLGLTGLLDGNSSAAFLTTAQSESQGYELPMDKAWNELGRGGTFLRSVLHYSQSLLAQISQSAVCNRFHNLEEQFARWLLMCLDRQQDATREVTMTQEMIAHMLGVRREGINAVARRFQQDELINYRRGRIRVLNRKELEARACECYRVVKKAYNWQSRSSPPPKSLRRPHPA